MNVEIMNREKEHEVEWFIHHKSLPENIELGVNL